MKYNNRTAIITGGARGIGLAIAEVLAAGGANVVLVDVNLEAAQAAAAILAEQGVQTLALKSDVTSEADVQQMVDIVLDKFGQIDILVNNAGITRDGLSLRMQEADFDLVIKVNLKGVFLCSKAVAKEMMKKRYGRIINLSSVVGLMGNIGQANYAASKAGIIGLTKTMARELAARSITINAVAPGFIDTEMTQAIPEKNRNAMLTQIPMGRLGSVAEVANVVAFLASDLASYVTGEVIRIDGGMAM